MSDTKQPSDGFDLIEYPVDYVFKAMCRNDANAIADLISQVQQSMAEREVKTTQRDSRNGKYIALSIGLRLQSREELELLYKTIAANPCVVMTL